MSNPVTVEEVSVDVDLEVAAASEHSTFFSTFTSSILNLSVTAIRSLTGPICRVWTNFYTRVVVWEDTEIMQLKFIISSLIGFLEIKAQGQVGFPFQTHPQAIMVSVTSLLFFGLASLAQHVISASGLDPASVYVIIVRLGRIVSFCILVASLASLFYL